MDKSEILAEIKKLPEKDRIRIAEVILDSLSKNDPITEKKWIKETARRFKAVQKGKIKTVPGSKVFQKADEIISRRD